ncbi:hypothetical protein MY8738_000329 [Beauveria namnaoensis]
MDSQEQLRALVEQDKSMLRIVDFDNFRSAPQLDAQAHSSAQGLPPISVLPLAGQYLSVLTPRASWGAKEVLQVGTLGGYSSICFAQAGARASPAIEIDAKHRDVTLQKRRGTRLLGSLDGHSAEIGRGGTQIRPCLTRPNGCIFLDDVVASMFKDGQVEEGGEENILTRVGKDKRVQATLVPIVACHAMVPTPIFNGFIFGTRLG